MGEAKRKPVHRFRTMSGSDVTAADCNQCKANRKWLKENQKKRREQ